MIVRYTTLYHLFGGQYWFGNNYIVAGLEQNPANAISHYDLGFGFQIFQYSSVRQREGVYGQVVFSQEDNMPGYYSQSSISYSLRSIINLAIISPHLNRLVVSHEVGIQQHFIRYRSDRAVGVETSSSLTGGFSLGWMLSDYLKPAVGYVHERDSSLSGITTGFTGVFYAEIESKILPNYFVFLRGFGDRSQVYEITLETRM